MTGKIDDAEASAPTPIMRPKKMLVNVPEADCSTLESISGMRNTSIVRQIGFESSMAAPRLCIRNGFARKDVVPAAANPPDIGAISSVGRAGLLHGQGRRFEPVIAHQFLADEPHARVEHVVECGAREHQERCRARRTAAIVVGAGAVIRTARRSATAADRIRARVAGGTGRRCFAAIECKSDHFTDELSVDRNSATAGFRWDARSAFGRIVIETQRGFPRH